MRKLDRQEDKESLKQLGRQIIKGFKPQLAIDELYETAPPMVRISVIEDRETLLGLALVGQTIEIRPGEEWQLRLEVDLNNPDAIRQIRRIVGKILQEYCTFYSKEGETGGFEDRLAEALEGKLAVWLDDERDMPEGYDVHIQTAEDCLNILRTGRVRKISFDHDLGEGKSGYVVAKWIEERAYHGKINKIRWQVHSANPVGRDRIVMAMTNADKFWAKQH